MLRSSSAIICKPVEHPTPLKGRWIGAETGVDHVMSRKHWSDLLLFAAAVGLLLAGVLNNGGRVISIFSAVCFVGAAIARRQRMI